MNDYSKIFEFNFLNKNDFINLYKEKKKQESEYLINELKYQEKIFELKSNEEKLQTEKKQIENEKEELQNKINKYEHEKIEQEQNETSLKSEVSKQKEEIEKLKSEIAKLMKKQEEQNRGILFEPSKTDFTGIINHLRQNINQINFSASSIFNEQKDYYPINVSKFEVY